MAARRGSHRWWRYLLGLVIILFAWLVVGTVASLLVAIAIGGQEARLLRLVEQGRLKTHIDRAVSWREADVTSADLIGRRFSGKAVLHVD